MRELLKRSEVDLLRSMFEEDMGFGIGNNTTEWKGTESRKDFHACTDPIYHLLCWYYNEKGHQYIMYVEDFASAVHGFLDRAAQYCWESDAEAVITDTKVLEKCFEYSIENLPKVINYQEKYQVDKYWGPDAIEISKQWGDHLKDPSVSYVAMVSKWRMLIGK